MNAVHRAGRMIRPLVLALVFTGALAVPAASNAQAATPFCGIRWGSLGKSLDRMTSAPITNVRTGQHTCFDRLVVDLRGKGANYSVHYVNVVRNQGQGAPIPLRGGARLEIVVKAPAYNINTGAQTYRFNNPRELSNVTGFSTFRQVAWGGSFEGYTTIGLGVRARLPMRAFILDGPGGGSRVVIDVAHKWWQPGTTTKVTTAPTTFVAQTDRYALRQAVAVYATATGRLVRYLTPAQPCGSTSSPLLDPTGKTVAYSVGAGTCASDIYRVAVDGKATPVLLVGSDSGPVLEPAIAPAGDRIAYVQGHCDSAAAELVVRRLTGGAPAVVLYRAAQGEGMYMVRWGRNGLLSFLTTEGPSRSLHTMTATPGGRIYSSPPAPKGCFWSGAAWFVQAGQDRLLASQQCGAGSRWLVLDQHLGTVRTLAAFGNQLGAQAISVDASGTWVIYQENGASIAGTIWRWNFASSSKPQRVTQGPYSPSWR
jgi:hypothetical protein